MAAPKATLKKYRPKNPKKKIEEKILITKILPYSAKKSKANPPPPYSTLKPETNSDSPSAKSKGARLVSARIETNQIKKIGNPKKKNNKSSILKNSKVNQIKTAY